MKSPYLSSFITGMSNFAIQYNFQAIAIALIMMSASECTTDDSNCRSGIQQQWVYGTASASVFIGAIIGQLSMGYLGDLIGRNMALMLTLLIATVAGFLQGVAPSGSAESVYASIIVLRFFLGIGLGGVYPLSATKSSEDASHHAGKVSPLAACWAFFWQMPGVLTPWLLAYIFSQEQNTSVSAKWRLVLALGSVPCLFAVVGLIVEAMISEATDSDATNQASVSKHDGNTNGGSLIKKQKVDLRKAIHEGRNMEYLLVAGGCWFLYDIVMYGVSLIGGEILDAIDQTDDNVSSMSNIKMISEKQMTAIVLGIPSTIAAIYVIPYLGLKKLQYINFGMMAVMLFLMAVLFYPLKKSNSDALYALYCLTYVTMQAGTSLTTYSMASALFDREVRSTFSGIISAIGKLGAVVGSYSFHPIAIASTYAVVMAISCGVSVLGGLVTFVYIDEKRIEETSSSGSNTPESHSGRNADPTGSLNVCLVGSTCVKSHGDDSITLSRSGSHGTLESLIQSTQKSGGGNIVESAHQINDIHSVKCV